MSIESVASRNERIRNELRTLIRSFGNLELRLSGEGKVSFKGLSNNAWVGFIHLIIDGDSGCMKALPGYKACALDNVFALLSNLKPVPNINDPENEMYVMSKDEWKRQIANFFEFVISNPTLDVYDYQFNKHLDNGQNEVVSTIRITPVVNRYVAGEYDTANSGELVGFVKTINHFALQGVAGTWRVDCVIEPFDSDTEQPVVLDHDNTTVYRNVTPNIGDYVLRDSISGKFVILPKDDYPGAFH